MSYPAEFREHFITPLNRKAATVGKYGVDSAGVTWEEGTPMRANVDYQKGKSAMNAGALDAYAVKIVRMNFTSTINERSRIKYQDKIYQIMPETFNGNYRQNTLQFLMQLVNEKQQAAHTPSNNGISGGSNQQNEIGT